MRSEGRAGPRAGRPAAAPASGSPALSICLLESLSRAGGPSTEGTSTGNSPQPLLANSYVQQEEQL